MVAFDLRLILLYIFFNIYVVFLKKKENEKRSTIN